MFMSMFRVLCLSSEINGALSLMEKLIIFLLRYYEKNVDVSLDLVPCNQSHLILRMTESKVLAHALESLFAAQSDGVSSTLLLHPIVKKFMCCELSKF